MPIDEGFRGQGEYAGPKLNLPVPDPSLLTTQQLREAILNLKELTFTRLDAMDAATDLRLESYNRLPHENDVRIQSLKDVQEEKFRGIAQQFNERDVRTGQASSAADDALKAALQAAKELVGAQGEASAAAAVKSETSFTKQIDQIGTIIQTLEKALDARITELKERIDRGEGQTTGANASRSERRADSSIGVSLIAAISAVCSVAAWLFVLIR